MVTTILSSNATGHKKKREGFLKKELTDERVCVCVNIKNKFVKATIKIAVLLLQDFSFWGRLDSKVS